MFAGQDEQARENMRKERRRIQVRMGSVSLSLFPPIKHLTTAHHKRCDVYESKNVYEYLCVPLECFNF